MVDSSDRSGDFSVFITASLLLDKYRTTSLSGSCDYNKDWNHYAVIIIEETSRLIMNQHRGISILIMKHRLVRYTGKCIKHSNQRNMIS